MRELDRDEIEAFLGGQRIARLGCHAGGEMYVVPVIYAYGDGAVVTVTQEGRKVAMLRENPRVCVEVDEYDADGRGSWRSVIAYGSAEELAGEEIEAALALLRERFARGRARSLAAAAQPGRRRLENPPRRGVRKGRRASERDLRVCSERGKSLVWEWTLGLRRSITRIGGNKDRGQPRRRPPGARRRRG